MRSLLSQGINGPKRASAGSLWSKRQSVTRMCTMWVREGSVTTAARSLPPRTDTVGTLLSDLQWDLSAVNWLLRAGPGLILRNTEKY